MKRITQYNNVYELEFLTQPSTLRIGIAGHGNAYSSNVDEIEVDPAIVDIDNLNISSKSVKLRFSAPIACNFTEGKKNAMLCGVKLSENFDVRFPFNVIQDDNFVSSSKTWDEKVALTKADILKSWQSSKNTLK